ncbi:MAG: DUF1097 domain-containing protein [Hyphomicrobium sp.]
MNLVTALALVIGALGAVATWLFVGPLAGLGLSIWAAFIGWGSFYSAGGGEKGLKDAIIGALWGALMATVALVLIGMSGGSALEIAGIVGATVAVMILGAHVPLLSAIPAAVYGYAATAAFALMKAGALATSVDVTASPFVNVVASMVIGAIFGFISEKIAKSVAS